MIAINKHIVHKLIPYTMLPLTIFPILSFSKYNMLSVFNNTTLWWSLSSFILILFFLSKHYFFDNKNLKQMNLILIYLIWNSICIIRGLFVAETYWDWKGLIENSMSLLLPIVAYSASNKILTQSLLSYYIRRVLPLFIIFIFILRTDAYGFYLMPISIMIFFIPVLTVRTKILILLSTAIVILADAGARSNIIKFGIPYILLLIYYLKDIMSNRIIEAFRILFFVIPITLFLLGLSGTFNIFKIKEYLGDDISVMGTDGEGNRAEESFVADTRTFLYEEVIHSAIYNNYLIMGRTPARGNDSETFGLLEFEWTGRYERASNEIGLANIFTWTGIIGVIIFSLLLFHSSYLAVNKSNNIFIKVMGVYVAFRYLYSWVEDVNNFTLNHFMLWVMIGLCLSKSFRNMTDNEVAIWARGIFDNRYIQFQSFSIKKTLYERSKSSSFANML